MNVISPDDLRRGLMEQNTPENGLKISGVFLVCKEWGKTPLQTLDALRIEFPVLKDATLSYAGRLDPLAEGLMLVLIGEANKQREEYLGLDKMYEVEILFGIKTDTGDLLGVPTVTLNDKSISESDELDIKFKSIKPEELDAALRSLTGKQSFSYPIYSSKTVQGKPLHQWANEGRISEIEIPKTGVEIHSLEAAAPDADTSMEQAVAGPFIFLKSSEFLAKLDKALNAVSGDFRFEQIRDSWHSLPDNHPDARFPVLKIICSCSSGTYMRTLAEEIGKLYGVPAFAYSIKRTKIGSLKLYQQCNL